MGHNDCIRTSLSASASYGLGLDPSLGLGLGLDSSSAPAPPRSQLEKLPTSFASDDFECPTSQQAPDPHLHRHLLSPFPSPQTPASFSRAPSERPSIGPPPSLFPAMPAGKHPTKSPLSKRLFPGARKLRPEPPRGAPGLSLGSWTDPSELPRLSAPTFIRPLLRELPGSTASTPTFIRPLLRGLPGSTASVSTFIRPLLPLGVGLRSHGNWPRTSLLGLGVGLRSHSNWPRTSLLGLGVGLCSHSNWPRTFLLGLGIPSSALASASAPTATSLGLFSSASASPRTALSVGSLLSLGLGLCSHSNRPRTFSSASTFLLGRERCHACE